MHDLVILGGGPAGMSAALVAGRGLLHTVVINDEKPRNRVAKASHGFWTRDGVHALELLRHGKDDLANYSTVEYVADVAVSVAAKDGVFRVQTANGRGFEARRVILAAGHRDDLDALGLPGIHDVYGKSVFPCPFCDAYEHRGERIAVFGGKGVESYVPLVRNWSRDVTVFTNGRPLDPAAKESLDRNGVPYHEARIRRLEAKDGRLTAIHLEGNAKVERDVGFLWDKVGVPAVTFADDFGVARSLNPVGLTVYAADEFGRTHLPGLYVVGDARMGFQRLAAAAAEGSRCAEGIVGDIAREKWT
jgi:thioredoxin reductase